MAAVSTNDFHATSLASFVAHGAASELAFRVGALVDAEDADIASAAWAGEAVLVVTCDALDSLHYCI